MAEAAGFIKVEATTRRHAGALIYYLAVPRRDEINFADGPIDSSSILSSVLVLSRWGRLR
jgi:hypothetical protein